MKHSNLLCLHLNDVSLALSCHRERKGSLTADEGSGSGYAMTSFLLYGASVPYILCNGCLIIFNRLRKKSLTAQEGTGYALLYGITDCCSVCIRAILMLLIKYDLHDAGRKMTHIMPETLAIDDPALA